MFKLPDGREVVISSREGLAQVMTSGQVGDKFKVTAFVELFTRTSAKEVKELIRGKDKGESIAPIVKAFMDCGMSKATARNRHSDVKALWYGWMHQCSDAIGNANGWQASVDLCRIQKDKDEAAAEVIAERQAVLALRGQKEQEAIAAGLEPDLILIKETAETEYTEVKEAQDAEKKLVRLTKQAKEVGFGLFPLTCTLDDVMNIVTQFGLDDVYDAVVDAIEARDVATAADQAVKDAQNESNAAHVVHEIEAHKAETETA